MASGSQWDRISHAFNPGTSDVDWCEPNYVTNSHIAEFYNTISNSLFLVFPFVLMYLFRHYGQYVNKLCHLVWLLMVVVGAGSALFHGTLSLGGQLLDELAIVWVVFATVALWIPKRMLTKSLALYPMRFRFVVLAVTALCTYIGCLYPVVNNLVMASCIAPVAFVFYREAKSAHDEKSRHLGLRATILWLIGVSVWISDKTMCPFWLGINFPYLHAIWHIVVLFGGYEAIVFIAYKDTVDQYSKLEPVLLYWPKDNSWFGIPYIDFNAHLPIYRMEII